MACPPEYRCLGITAKGRQCSNRGWILKDGWRGCGWHPEPTEAEQLVRDVHKLVIEAWTASDRRSVQWPLEKAMVLLTDLLEEEEEEEEDET